MSPDGESNFDGGDEQEKEDRPDEEAVRSDTDPSAIVSPFTIDGENTVDDEVEKEEKVNEESVDAGGDGIQRIEEEHRFGGGEKVEEATETCNDVKSFGADGDRTKEVELGHMVFVDNSMEGVDEEKEENRTTRTHVEKLTDDDRTEGMEEEYSIKEDDMKKETDRVCEDTPSRSQACRANAFLDRIIRSDKSKSLQSKLSRKRTKLSNNENFDPMFEEQIPADNRKKFKADSVLPFQEGIDGSLDSGVGSVKKEDLFKTPLPKVCVFK